MCPCAREHFEQLRKDLRLLGQRPFTRAAGDEGTFGAIPQVAADRIRSAASCSVRAQRVIDGSAVRGSGARDLELPQ